jgi:hypothetical protein
VVWPLFRFAGASPPPSRANWQVGAFDATKKKKKKPKERAAEEAEEAGVEEAAAELSEKVGELSGAC